MISFTLTCDVKLLPMLELVPIIDQQSLQKNIEIFIFLKSDMVHKKLLKKNFW